MRILVLNGSPKAKSDTLRMTHAFLKGLNECGEHHVDEINVIRQKIAPCIGCFGCWQRGDGQCVQQDDLNHILSLYTQADLVIWSFPLYCFGMPSHLKAVLDRTIPLIQMKMVVDEDGSVRHEALVDFSKLHTLVISGCGFPTWEKNFESLRLQCEFSFGDPTMVFVPETPLMNNPAAVSVVEPKLARFEEAGREYAAAMSLSPDTIRALEAPMIPQEEYIRNINTAAEA